MLRRSSGLVAASPRSARARSTAAGWPVRAQIRIRVESVVSSRQRDARRADKAVVTRWTWAGAEGNGAKRTVVKSLFDGSEEAMALFCVWRAIQQPRTGIVSCFAALGSPTTRQPLDNHVSHQSGFPSRGRGEECFDIRQSVD